MRRSPNPPQTPTVKVQGGSVVLRLPTKEHIVDSSLNVHLVLSPREASALIEEILDAVHFLTQSRFKT